VFLFSCLFSFNSFLFTTGYSGPFGEIIADNLTGRRQTDLQDLVEAFAEQRRQMM